jgi:hypothetical protein
MPGALEVRESRLASRTSTQSFSLHQAWRRSPTVRPARRPQRTRLTVPTRAKPVYGQDRLNVPLLAVAPHWRVAFSGYLIRQGRAAGTQLKYDQALGQFAVWLNGRSPVLLSGEEIDHYLQWWRGPFCTVVGGLPATPRIGLRSAHCERSMHGLNASTCFETRKEHPS